jgi:two-component system CheB/CheR fusion protein
MEKFFLVLFQNLRPANSPPSYPVLSHDEPPAMEPTARKSEQEEEIQHLRQELAATKEYLQSVIESQEAFNEELRSANEEILSSNEELQSTNEERVATSRLNRGGRPWTRNRSGKRPKWNCKGRSSHSLRK